MTSGERSLTVIGWILPGKALRRELNRTRSRSRSSSILYAPRHTKELPTREGALDEIQAKTVTLIEGKRNLILYIEVEDEDDQQKSVDRQVTLEVNYAVSGIEG